MRYLAFPSLSFPGLSHGVFTRHGGVSDQPFHSLNIGYHVGDEPDNIVENRALIKQALGLKTMISAKQVHGDRVLVVTAQPDDDYEVDGYDALVTNCCTGLMVQQADCQAVMLFDPVQRVAGIVHSGWRGSVTDIIGKTVKTMFQAFGSRASDLCAAISPSLGPCCGEFVNFREELPASMHDYQVRDDYFDFWSISRDQLQTAGVGADRIEIAGNCTVCDEDFFSYRRDRQTGRFASVIGLVNGRFK
ncbi:MAG: peptidoglycan editing factor PgeF [Proteobacteria bacterium]|nr:peptidoglycan editing factor PgeF [Pseudomonadota bacterium]MBU1715563.1 peptidoglycan editing factor PgeF [Pseudomonadota bacterium]